MGEDRSAQRSHGQQSRSRERIEDVLRAAEALVAAEGYDGLKMRELARAAGLPIASLYHYFPSAMAVMRSLAERFLATLRVVLIEALEAELPPDLPPDQAPEAVGRVVRRVAGFLRQSPAGAAIWDALRAVPDLRALDMADTEETARLIEPFLTRAAAGLPPEAAADFALVLLEAVQGNLLVMVRAAPDRRDGLTEATVQLAMAVLSGLPRKKGDAPLAALPRKEG